MTQALQIIRSIKSGKNLTFELDEDLLLNTLMTPDIQDRNIVAISIAGAFRKGKSFLLSFFLRYLQSRYVKKNVSDDWLEDENEPLTGFTWRGGKDRDTTGILMWPEIFLYDSPNEKLAILLLDTQGLFDRKSSTRDDITIFALSTMLSSIQIFNVSQNIQENDLQQLQLFTEYGKFAAGKYVGKPFQKLQFLVRDWPYPQNYQYGAQGGDFFLDEIFNISDDQNKELREVRKHISSSFENIQCFLLPYPGEKVAINENFNGCLRDIKPEFVKYLKEFVPTILAPENLIIKNINNSKVKGLEFCLLFKSYLAMLRSNKIPTPKNIYTATAEVSLQTAVMETLEYYQIVMEEKFVKSNKPFFNFQEFSAIQSKVKTLAMAMFQNKPKFGEQKLNEKYNHRLSTGLNDLQNLYFKKNEAMKLEHQKIEMDKYIQQIKNDNEILIKELKKKEIVEQAFNEAEVIYKDKMDKHCKSEFDYIDQEELRNFHVSTKEYALIRFTEYIQNSKEIVDDICKSKMSNFLENLYLVFDQRNEKKKMNKTITDLQKSIDDTKETINTRNAFRDFLLTIPFVGPMLDKLFN